MGSAVTVLWNADSIHEVGYSSILQMWDLSLRNEITRQGCPTVTWQSCLPLLSDHAAFKAQRFSPQMHTILTKQ